MSDSLSEMKTLPEDERETGEAVAPEHWYGPRLRATLGFLAGPAALAVAIAVLGLRLPSPVLYGIAAIFGLILFVRSLRDPEWLLAVTLIYVPVNKVFVVPLLPGINGTNMLLLLLMFTWLLQVMREERPFFRPLPNSRLVGVWAALTLFSGVTSILTFGLGFVLEGQIGEYKAWLDQFILFFAFLNLIRDGHMARRVVVYMMLGTFVVMALGAQEALDKQGLDSIEKSRVLGPQNQPNDFGAFLVYSAAPFVGLFVVFIRNWRSWALLPYFAALAKLLLMTFSRGAYIGMTLAGLAAGYLRGKLFLIGWGVVALGLLLAMPELVPESLRDRMGHTGETPVHGEMDASSEHRLVLWNAAIDMSLESPVLGKGFKAFPVLKSRYTEYDVRESDNHNMYLYISSQMGIPALLMFLFILYRMFRLGTRLYRGSDDRFVRAVGMGAAAMVAGVLAINMFGSRMVSIDCNGYVWVYLAVLAHLWTEQVERQAKTEPSEAA